MFAPNGFAVVVVLKEKPVPPVVVVIVPKPDFPNRLPVVWFVEPNTLPVFDPNPEILRKNNKIHYNNNLDGIKKVELINYMGKEQPLTE